LNVHPSTLRSIAVNNLFTPILYLTVDVICWVSTESLSSISYRDKLFKWISSIEDKIDETRKPILVLISNMQNVSAVFDVDKATQDFMSLHDSRGEQLLLFSSVICARLPVSDAKLKTKDGSQIISDQLKAIRVFIYSLF
jgi:hypothetical protein